MYDSIYWFGAKQSGNQGIIDSIKSASIVDVLHKDKESNVILKYAFFFICDNSSFVR